MFKALALSAAVFLVGSTYALAEGDPDKGKKVFRKCKACHMVGEKAKNRVGPILNNVVGRTAGTLEGFKFSKAMIAAGTDGVEWSNGPLVWNDENLTMYLKSPKKSIPKNKMAFAGLKKDADMENVIAYLKTFTTE